MYRPVHQTTREISKFPLIFIAEWPNFPPWSWPRYKDANAQAIKKKAVKTFIAIFVEYTTRVAHTSNLNLSLNSQHALESYEAICT